MTPQAQEDFTHHVRRYLYVFYALLFGTLVTVGASYIPFGNHAINIAVALVIACGKAFLVAGFFMHLVAERKVIYWVLVLTATFVVVMVGLIMFAHDDQQGKPQGIFAVPQGHVPAHHAEASEGTRKE